MFLDHPMLWFEFCMLSHKFFYFQSKTTYDVRFSLEKTFWKLSISWQSLNYPLGLCWALLVFRDCMFPWSTFILIILGKLVKQGDIIVIMGEETESSESHGNCKKPRPPDSQNQWFITPEKAGRWWMTDICCLTLKQSPPKKSSSFMIICNSSRSYGSGGCHRYLCSL